MNYEGGSYAVKPQLRSYDVGSTSHITPSFSPLGETLPKSSFLHQTSKILHTSKFKHQTSKICTHQTKS